MSITDAHNKRYSIKIFKITGMVIGSIIIAVIFAFIFGYIVLLLWNWLMPALFGLGTITYMQAFGLILLAKILFSGFKGHPHPHSYNKTHWTKHYHKYFNDKNGSLNNESEYFNSFWKNEGKQAFDEYVMRMKTKEKEKGDL